MMPCLSFIVPYNIPSQNVRERKHWRWTNADKKNAERIIRIITTPHNQPQLPDEKRFMVITSYRRQRITDDANLRGGAKGLVDALVRVGFLVDDSIHWALIDYKQEVLSKYPRDYPQQYRGVPCTHITVTGATKVDG
jgi:hypothetical protein